MGKTKGLLRWKMQPDIQELPGLRQRPDGKLVINPEQAETVRLIYRLFLDGLSANAIAKELTSQGIKTVTGKDKWSDYVVNYVFGNESTLHIQELWMNYIRMIKL